MARQAGRVWWASNDDPCLRGGPCMGRYGGTLRRVLFQLGGQGGLMKRKKPPRRPANRPGGLQRGSCQYYFRPPPDLLPDQSVTLPCY